MADKPEENLEAFLARPMTQQVDTSVSAETPKGKATDPSLSGTQDRHLNLHESSIPADIIPLSQKDGFSSWSASLDKQLGSPPSNTDRVFPIRSVVSVDPSQTTLFNPARRKSTDSSDYFVPGPGAVGDMAGLSPPQPLSDSDGTPTGQAAEQRGRERRSPIATSQDNYDRPGGENRSQLFNGDDRSNNLNEELSSKGLGTSSPSQRGPSSDQGSVTEHITVKYKHVVTTEGHAVITGRDGEELQRCEDEAIHIPGAVQGFGLLIALEQGREEGILQVRIASENSYRMIGYTPQELFKLKTFCDILSQEQQDNLLDHIDFIQDEDAEPASNGPKVFSILIHSPPHKKMMKFWCAIHINPNHPNLIICEFEFETDEMYPLSPTSDDTPETPEDTLHGEPTEEEYAESTLNISKPLRVLRSARKRKGEAATMEVFNVMAQIQEQLDSASDLESFLKILVGVVRELTGFHRVMIYQFDSSFNGRVVTELVDPRATVDLYKGLNFPASDIPKQARELYKLNKVRLLYDRDLETARLVCRTVEDLDNPLDLSFSYLRAMSPIHLKYLANMAVRSSMSISINAFGDLWGLIACHSYGPKGMRVSFPIREMCRLVGNTASRSVERLSYASRLKARKLINTIPTDANPSGYIIASSDDLLKLFDADLGVLSIGGETKILGKLEQSQEVLAMLEYLRMQKITSVIISRDITADFPDLRYTPGFVFITGLLLVPLGENDFIVFFRRGIVNQVKWAGNPYEKFVKEGTTALLEPRMSFKTWSETVIGQCREWTEEQVETAAVLRLVYGKFIKVWRQKEDALQSSHLSRLLLANSAHEVRTPLNAIINYLEIALEGTLDQETRDNLAKSHSASKSLIYVINDLLDLTKSEEGKDLMKYELFDLPDTVREAADSFRGDAKRRGIGYEVVVYPEIPQFVYGDSRRIRQAVVNITANAMQHTSKGWIRIELWRQEILDGKVTVEIVVQDTGAGMSNRKVDALFRDLEQITTDIDDALSDTEKSKQATEGKEQPTLGLGLAMVARIVRNMDGQLRLKSEEGRGSRFVMQLPFVFHANESQHHEENEGPGTSIAVTPPPTTIGELTLIEKSTSLRSEGVLQNRILEESSSLRRSESASSNRSNRSSNSVVDRLIEAISSSLSADDLESEELPLQRSISRESAHSQIITRITPGRMLLANETSDSSTQLGSLSARGHVGSLSDSHQESGFATDDKTTKEFRMADGLSEIPQDDAAVLKAVFNTSIVEEPTLSTHGESSQLNAENLQVLVAEDNPINSRILKKRLEKIGHNVYLTVNGEECMNSYREKPAFFDVVLMDIQMPIVDGLTSTKMIRSFEKTVPASNLSRRAGINGRVPIFAVSASLAERELQTYLDAGFDGWVMKPIDFKRLDIFLTGIVDDNARNLCVYKAGQWERGGWFQARQSPV
ncbi:hypothetical protein V497_09333 [Pseudogymnoascus sp. VKM F-4516 (FW-969)]|nr:hypothetical protein V497_09333 [Pseudogymnoascus sp. VKM F-4516 (FW-969)]